MTGPGGVRAAFTERFGARPEGVWSAPGRVNLIGEHTDYNDGFVLPFAIDRRVVAAVRRRDDNVLRVASTFADEAVEVPLAGLGESGAARVSGWAGYLVGVAWALGRQGVSLADQQGLDIVIDSDVPVGAGLSSSAAIECAVAVAMNDLWALHLPLESLVDAGHEAENTFVGAPTGILDQSASLLAARDHAVFLDCRSRHTELIPLGLADAGLTITVIDTGVRHAHADGAYRERRASCEQAARLLGVAALRDVTLDELRRSRDRLDPVTFRRARHIVTENDRVLRTVDTLRHEGVAAIGDLLDASHRSMRDDFEISVPELDLAVETAQNFGAPGARMTGGGFGGSAIALTPREAVSRVEAGIAGAFAEHGYTPPVIFTVTADAGARRDA
ncbi:MAG TPA: galactokinase [Microbacteriaceae bacterium]|nr:galactokinase [Microbacteriaceae bacterium]